MKHVGYRGKVHVLVVCKTCTSCRGIAVRATRSASRKAASASSSSDDDSHCLLLALSHDELGVIVDGLADPLQPVAAVALSSTCLRLRTPLLAALAVLKQQHERAKALCRKSETSCAELRDAEALGWVNIGHRSWNGRNLTAEDMATLGMILRANGLPRLRTLFLDRNGFGDEGAQALCEALGCGAAPSLVNLHIACNQFGPAGAESLAAALRRGAMPKLEELSLISDPIGSQGAASLPAPLRKLPLESLVLSRCGIGDEGVASLVANLGKDDFKALTALYLYSNALTDAGCATLIAAMKSGAMPSLKSGKLAVWQNDAASAEAKCAVDEALDVRLGVSRAADLPLPLWE